MGITFSKPLTSAEDSQPPPAPSAGAAEPPPSTPAGSAVLQGQPVSVPVASDPPEPAALSSLPFVVQQAAYSMQWVVQGMWWATQSVWQLSSSEASQPPPAPSDCAAEPPPSTQAGTAVLQVSVPVASDPPEPAELSSLPLVVQQAAHSMQWVAQGMWWATQSVWQPSASQPQSVVDLSALYVPLPGSLATSPAVLDALHAHALAAGTVLTREAIQNYVALGERVVRAIEESGTGTAQRLAAPVVATLPAEEIPTDAAQEAVDVTGQSSAAGVQRLKVTTQDGEVEVTANQEVTRAIAWYVVACAAQQDVNQQATSIRRMVNGKEVTDLSISGSYVFNDPGQAIYRFMQSSPLAYIRESTHFNEISANPKNAWGKPDQHGIEDYDRRLPGQNGTILFDSLHAGTDQQIMFMKFESAGMPHVLSSAQRVDDMGQGSASAYMASQRVLAHAMSFVETRFRSPPGVERKEHVYKGVLKSPVHDPFMEVIRTAAGLGLLEPEMSASLHAKQLEERGFPHLDATLNQLQQKIDLRVGYTPAWDDLRVKLAQTAKDIQQVKAQLGLQSDHLGIVRRGAETHVNLKPSPHAVIHGPDSDVVPFPAADSDSDFVLVSASDADETSPGHTP